MYVVMAENNNLTYDAWREYLKNDKEMNTKWKSLVALWENVKKNLKENLETLPHSEALKRRKFLTAKNIFNIISTAKEKPNFNWTQKLIFNEEDERYEYVIQCLNPSSDYLFRKIKEERGVANMHGESINKYLQPIADKIWALKETLRVSINPEVKKSDLSYESLKTKKAIEIPEWVENHYTGDDENIVNEDGDVVLNPKYEHVFMGDPEVIEDETITVTRMGKSEREELVEKKKEGKTRKEPKQLEIPFEYED